MPILNQALPRKPSPLGGTDFRLQRVLNANVDPNNQLPGVCSAMGGLIDKRGIVYEGTAQRIPVALLTRQGTHIIQSSPRDFGTLEYCFVMNISATVYILTMDCIDNVWWGAGYLDDGASIIPVIFANPYGNDPLGGTGFVDRSGEADAVYGFGRCAFIRKARDTGYLYYTVQESGPNMQIMRGTVYSSPFASVTTTPLNMGGQYVAGFDVSSDGQTQVVVGNTGSIYRSGNAGASWSFIGSPNNAGPVVYSKAWKRWFSAGLTGPMYSTDASATSWAQSTIDSQSVASTTQFTMVEKLDPDGYYLLAVNGYAPALTYISEDGGKKWYAAQQLLTPYYDTSAAPTNKVLALANSGKQILLYQGSTAADWNGDNGLFVSGLITL